MSDAVEMGLGLARDLIGRFFPDKSKQEQEQLIAVLALMQSQMAVNAEEAKSPNMFVAGWRPYIGWVCGTGFAVQFVVGPLLSWSSRIAGHPVDVPALDLGVMMPLLLGMLGLGALRTAEKVQGAEGNR